MKSCPTCQASYPSRFSVCPHDGAALIESTEWSEGTVVRGKYRILGKVGQGGMGAVYKASHVIFDELRALKVINLALTGDEHFLKRFKQEAVIARRLDHPNAVRVDDIDESESGLPFIVMEYIEGRSLKDLIEREAPLSAVRTCSIARQVASALNAAHLLGMVHRDVKPANVVLIQTPRGEQAKVLDFGIAKLKDARSGDSSGITLTGTGMVMGTPQYMSPEQALGKRGDELDGRSDLYSLGVVMYQMLTGNLPFKADTTMQLLLAHINTPPRPVLEARPGSEISPALAGVVMKCLEKNPDLRPATGAALIEELTGVDAETTGREPREAGMISATADFPAPHELAPTEGEKAPPLPPTFTTPAEDSQGQFARAAAPGAKRTASKGIVVAVIAAIIVIGIIGIVWGYHHPKSPSTPQTQAALPASQEEAAPSAASPSSTPPAGTLGVPEAEASKTTETAETEETGKATKINKTDKTGNAAGRGSKGSARGAAGPVTVAAARTTQKTPQTQRAGKQMANENPPPSPVSPQPASNPSLSSVIVTTAPGAHIFIDGKSAGFADASGKLTAPNLSPGSHGLRATLAGFNDIEYTIRVPPGATSFVSAKWGASQTAVPTGPAQANVESNPGVAQRAAASFPVTYLHTFGSSRGLLVIQGGKVHYQPANGSGAFISPLTGISWGSSGGNDFNIRLKDGHNYRFRSPSAAEILATLKRAASAP